MFQKLLESHSFSKCDFYQDFLPTVEDRAFWDSFGDEKLIREAEAELDFSWPIIKATDFMEFKKSGNRTIMQTPHFDRREHLVLFALAELKENKGRFLPQVVNGLLTTCEETFWGLSAHWPNRAYEFGNFQSVEEPYIDLYAAETAEHVCVITKLLQKPLQDFCPEILDRVSYELERRIKAPYLCHRDWGWMGYHKKPNNWNPWILSNVLTVFLLTESREHTFDRALKKLLTEIQHYYDGMPSDGGCDEGADYWNRAGASLFEFLYQLKQASHGAVDLFDDEKLGRIAAYMKKAHTVKDCYANVADNHTVGKAASMFLLFGFARETKQEDLMRFAASVYHSKGEDAPKLTHRTRTVRRLIYQAEFLREILTCRAADFAHGAVEYLPDMQLAVLREGAWTLTVKGGHNHESHNHNDVGSYTLYEGDTPVLVDVGIGTYTRFTFEKSARYTMIPWTRSITHNLPIVGGVEQKQGDAFRADRFEVAEKRAEVSFANAYPVESGLSSLVRAVTLEKDAVTVTDQFAFSKENAIPVTEVLMSILPVRMEGGDVILGERYRISANGSIRTEWMAFEDAELENDWKTDGVTRILIENDSPDRVTVRVTEYQPAN